MKTIVPMQLDGNWTACEKWRPTTLRFLPGEANAWEHTQEIENSDGAILEEVHRYESVKSVNGKLFRIKIEMTAD